MAADKESAKFYWCIRHQRVESEERCGSELLMGPYDSADAAQRYAETAKDREDSWKAEDERWEGS